MKGSDNVDFSQQLPEFEAWLQTPLGRQLLADQRELVDQITDDFSGAHQLVVTISHRLPLATGSDFGQRMMTTSCWSSGLPDGVVVCDADELPFPAESMDLVVLHHTHDFSGKPHQVVREAARVLRSCGHLLIIGFNPFSSWGLRKLVMRARGAPWSGHFVARRRLEDWLSLLEFEIDHSATRFYHLPLRASVRVHRAGAIDWLATRLHLPGGAYYGILAEKKVPASTDVKKGWRQLRLSVVPATGVMGAAKVRGSAPGRKTPEPAQRGAPQVAKRLSPRREARPGTLAGRKFQNTKTEKFKAEDMTQTVTIYTDGACKGNPGPGGWGVLFQYREKDRELYGGEHNTTNNRMELMAAIEGLKALSRACQVHLYTDSQYVRKGITEWMTNWKKNGWKTAARKPVKNEDLWKALDAEIHRHEMRWHWVKGHSGNPGNEKADQLANQGVAELQSKSRTG